MKTQWTSIDDRLPDTPKGIYDIEVFGRDYDGYTYTCWYGENGIFLNNQGEIMQTQFWAHIPSPVKT